MYVVVDWRQWGTWVLSIGMACGVVGLLSWGIAWLIDERPIIGWVVGVLFMIILIGIVSGTIQLVVTGGAG